MEKITKHIDFWQKDYYNTKEDEQNREWRVVSTAKGGDAYVIRANLSIYYIHTIYTICNNDGCRY